MLKEPYHPKAYLTEVKNIKRGLLARTKILNALDKGSTDAKTLAEQTGMHYNVVMHHLRLLEVEGIVERKRSKPNVWTLTGLGQKRLI
ncbi:MAG: ArsR family transcriptional regulator [Candidatus Bathyarchaeia archaeon]